MKIKFLVAATSFALTACSITDSATTQNLISNTHLETQSAVNHDLGINDQAILTNTEVITLEQIMADPDWFARSPESWYWGDDNETIFYKQKRQGNPLRDLYKLSLKAGDNKAEQVKLAEMHVAADRNAVLSGDGKLEAYSFKGNVFVKELKTNHVLQLTHTSAYEHSVLFLTNGNLAYRVGNVFYSHNLQNNQIIELANLQMQERPKDIAEPTDYLAKEQHGLIDYIAIQHRNAKLTEQQKHELIVQNSTITNSKYYFGKGNKVRYASLSPAGDKVFVSIRDAKSSRHETDIMPNYISKDGQIKAEKVRHRVADNRQYKEELFVIDLKSGQKSALGYESLPGFDEDVLASVKKENYERLGKQYQSKKSPRNIHVLSSRTSIQWHKNGQRLAVMLEAWDNKDRWLTTVDFEKNILVSQHRLHDDAWINWAFNEFGWLNKSDRLYFLSEESGYSHLYVKALGKKAIQLTSGKFEVSNVTLTKDEQSFVFKANKKHPGIYEIYQVDLTKKLTALTNLGGMNDYTLSPDESKLLIQHSTVIMPPELYVQSLDNISGAAIKITDTVTDKFKSFPWTTPSVVAVNSSYQDEPVYSRVYFPNNFDKTVVKNKAVMFTHGAGYLQNSHLGWSGYFRETMFHSMLLQQGYVVIDMDYRASKGYGRDWRTAIYRHMGKPEVEDMRDGVNWLVENANVDRQRIGTYGGSYGGFLTLMSMFTAPDLFESGSAIRLVSDWAYYNHGYTSNILNTPKDDAIAYERSSPIYFAEGLEKPLLINAPMVDNNVFFQDTVRLVQRLIELEKQDFETAIYPVEPHGFVQPSSWLNEYRRIYKLFENTL
ncbi:MAG: prolyl oligopeptidase family serine peptidase [Colwellia sp.]|nr:prolyl oligopeptidase family serine peptidase [Colwellia sp.]